MLDSMRALSKSFVSKLLMLFLVVSFAVWGVGDILRSNGPSYAVKVGGETVGINEFQRHYSQLKRQLEETGFKDLKSSQIAMSTVRQLVQQQLNLQTMYDLGLYANEALLAKEVAKIPAFQDKKTGKFDSKTYKATLRAQNLPEKVFLNQLKKDVAAEFLANSLRLQDANVPASVQMLEAVGAGETRDAVLITIPARASEEAVSDDVLRQFYEQNKEALYLRPETRTLSYVALAPADIDALVDASITPEMVAQEKARTPKLTDALARLKLRDTQREEVLHNLGNVIEDEIAAGKKLQEALAKAGVNAAPKTLAGATKLAGQMSLDEVTRTVTEQGFGLGEGEISGLVSTKGGTSLLVSVTAIQPASPKAFEEVKADVKTRIIQQQARNEAQKKAVSIKTALATTPNWQDVINGHTLASRMVSNVPRPESGKQAANIPPSLQSAIFEREVGEAAGPLTLENGDQMLALITASHMPQMITASQLKPNQQTIDRLSGDVENRAYLSFSKKHPVEVNPAIMQSDTSEE